MTVLALAFSFGLQQEAAAQPRYQMNYWDWQHADGQRNVNADYLYEQLDRREIPIVVMEPLLGGRLASPAASVANRLKERDPQASMASWAFRFTGSYPRILTILSGMVYMEHLQDNLKTFQGFKPLSEEELEYLSKDIADIMAILTTSKHAIKRPHTTTDFLL